MTAGSARNSYDPILETGPFPKTPNLGDYTNGRTRFAWDGVASELDRPNDTWNIAHEAVDRIAAVEPDRVALRWLPRSGDPLDITYSQLARETFRFASALDALGVRLGSTVFILTNRIPELHVSLLGALKHGSAVSPLFSAFGPEPIETRMTIGQGRVLVTTDFLYRRKVEPIRDRLPHLEHVIVVDTGRGGAPADCIDFRTFLETGRDDYPARETTADDVALIHFTSGTTGQPKGAVHTHQAVLHHYVSARYALDLHPGDVYWCTADPGWVTGVSYGIIAPLACGVTSIVDEAEFDPDRWYRTIQDHRVEVWYTAPTAIRMLMKAGSDIPAGYDLSSLRLVASVGEPLNPEAVVWGQETLGHPIHDNWWQTETGGIMIANFLGTEIRPGSMGRPLPGIEAVIVRRDDTGKVMLDDSGEPVIEDRPLTEGELAIRTPWPSMFRGYLGQEERYRRCFAGSWYLSGDLAEMDSDGYFWFVGRADDVIKSAGHLIGPFEVESALMDHPAVAEAGVIGIPDEVAGEVVKAFVTLHSGYEWSEELENELMAWARVRLGASIAPRHIAYEPQLPLTRSGKIMRRLLKAWELGLPTGDLSTLEGEDT